MDRKSLAALFLLGIAVLFGIVTDLLLTDVSWGLNVSFWSAVLLVVVHFSLKARDKRGLVSHWPLACLILHFAGLFAWRDSTTLKALDGIVLFSLIAILAARIRYEWSPWQPFGEYAARVSSVLLSGFTGAASVVQKDVDWKQLSEGEYAGAAKAVGRGFLFALPLVLLFTFLLASADVRFERLL